MCFKGKTLKKGFLLIQRCKGSNYFLNSYNCLSLFSNDQHSFCFMFHSEAVVNAFANHPNNFFATAKHILIGFFTDAFFLVSQEIAHQLLTFHTKRNEPISCLPQAYIQFSIQLVCIEASSILIFGNDEVGRIRMFLMLQEWRSSFFLLFLSADDCDLLRYAILLIRTTCLAVHVTFPSYRKFAWN